MTSLTGCVLPVGPQFEGPPTEENFAPVIERTQPLQGSMVTAGAVQTFSITVTDPNVRDDLYFRWLGEFPSYSTNTQRLVDDQKVSHSANGERLHASQSLVLSCLAPLARRTDHLITALVSDRPFWDPSDPKAPSDLETLLTGIIPGAQKAEAHWFLNLPCQQ